MREIKFRGKSISGWAFGHYTTMPDNEKERCPVIENERGRIKVNPETVGQFTGEKDYRGQRIYEGDLVRVEYTSPCTPDDFIGAVIFDEGRWWVSTGTRAEPLWNELNVYHVTGNIHDTP